MNGNTIRLKFLEYFAKHGHTVVESSSLVPTDDPTLLFTNAGMVQFKTVFMGEERRDFVRATSSQRCVRAGGKHNDLENVGYTARHHTFFEMLGNFSFGDYFKEDAIRYAWEFLITELGLPPEKLWVSVYEEDDEAFLLWEKVEGLLPGRIVRLGEKDNFWAMGDTGPCGPCSEIHIDQGAAAGCGRPDCALGCDCDRFLELWNLVFMQFNRTADGVMTRLPRPSIDTGMGLERVAAVLQGKINNYDSDLFAPIIRRLEELSGRVYGQDPADTTAMRVIADHSRATTFLVADGVLPSNEGRGYVLRRIMRRAVRFGRNLGLDKPFMDEVTATVVVTMNHAYPHLLDAVELLKKVVINEEERFRETLENGLVLLDEEIERICQDSDPVIGGGFIFKLYDTFGFPMDIVRDISLEKKIGFDEAGFHEAMAEQRAKSRASWKGDNVKLREQGVKDLVEAGVRAEFIGYEHLNLKIRVKALLGPGGLEVPEIACGAEGRLFVLATPFYAESGGQAGDVGTVQWPGGRATILGTAAGADGIILHHLRVAEGVLRIGQEVELAVAREPRGDTAANHTATHLLQAAMREILGDHIKQAGSLVTPERLRFDFTHFTPLSQEEISRIELRVNEKIRENIVVDTRILARDEAIEQGATALFGEKYGDRVRVVAAGDFSRELCGGTHVAATGAIGLFKIVSEGGIASGVRRIEALTGRTAFASIQGTGQREHELCQALNVRPEGIHEKFKSLIAAQKQLEKQVADLATRLAATDLEDLFTAAVEVNGVKVLAAKIALDSPQTLREAGDRVRDHMGSGVAVLGGVIKEKVALLAIVSNDLTTRIPAGLLVGRVAAMVGGKGGGRADMAQAGGPMTDKLNEAIAAVPKCVQEILAG
ncbi:MAG: alanine--tRNA ligase [Desulfoarculaceae bacterium]|nr:alanine--tRNA ligase [Desulfoarculaceae bacterium]